MSYTTWDIECTTRTSFKRKANPFDPLNWVVTHGFKRKGGEVTEHRFGSQRPGPGWLAPVLEGCRLLIGFNIKFDLLHALQDRDNLEVWMGWVAGGGQVWDCQLAEYLLCGMGQKDQMLSLDDVAPRYGGNPKIDEVKALWAAGVDTPDIEPALLTRYLCGGLDEHGVWQMGDVENTEKIALGQIARAREAGQLNSILLNMGALLFTVEAERNGMFVDKPKGLELAAKLEQKVTELGNNLAQYLPKDLPFDFKWSSRFHKSALIFGGSIKYPRREYMLAKECGFSGAGEYVFDDQFDGPEDMAAHIAYATKSEYHYVLADGSTMECSWYEHVRDTEWQGTSPEAKERVLFAGGKQKGEAKTKKVTVPDRSKPKSRMGTDTYTFPRVTAPAKKWETSEPGVWSTASDVIEELGSRGIPFLTLLAELQKLAKDLGTYYITTDEDGKQTGMLTLVDALGIIHHKLNMCSTVTARLSSSDPNLQNIPKGNNSDIKTVFVSRFGPEGKIIQSDFSSLEVYVQAILTECKQLIADLKSGLDLHVVRLAAKEHRPYEEVLALCKGPKAEKEWDYKRTAAKVYSFQRAFGAGVPKIAAETGMSEEEVQALSDAEDARYPEIPAYYSNITEVIKANRKPAGIHVPHPEVRGVMCHIGQSSFRTPDQKLYTYRESPSPAWLVRRGVTASFSPTEIKNYVVQGTGGEWAKAAMWLSVRAFYATRNFGGLALLVNQVHDAVYVDAHCTVDIDAAATLHACMEGASDLMEHLFKWKIPVPVPSDTTWGASMIDEDAIPGLRELARPLREQLRREYMGGFVPSFETK